MWLLYLLSSSWISVLLVLVATVAYWYLSMPRDVPPGPRGLPFVGFLPFLGSNPALALSKLSEKYGGIISLYLGNRFVVLLNDARAHREAFIKQGETFAGRPYGLDMSSGSGLLFEDGQHFTDHRRFALHILKNCGLGRSSLEPLVMDEVQHFLAAVKSQNGAPYDLRTIMYLSIANNIVLMTLGHRFNYDDPWLTDFLQNAETSVQFTSSVGLITFFPWLRYVPGLLMLLGKNKLLHAEKRIDELLNKLFHDYEVSQPVEERTNYFNAFKEEQKARRINNPEDNTFSDKTLKSNIRLFLIAGSETTATTLIWFLLYMMAYPKVQKKVQKEIDDIIGMDRLPSCQDQAMTPYTLATITEVQRLTTLVPLSVPHRNKQECRVNGYRIPKDSFILSNLWHVHNDPEDFPDPSAFRPERNLDNRGRFVKSENVMPFSLGKRQCMGEPLARMELYLYVTAMMQIFDFRSPDGIVPSLDGKMNVTFLPKSFVTCAQLRHGAK